MPAPSVADTECIMSQRLNFMWKQYIRLFEAGLPAFDKNRYVRG